MTATIQANGIRIAYRFDGPEDAPVVLFSNSLMSNFTMWDAQVATVESCRGSEKPGWRFRPRTIW